MQPKLLPSASERPTLVVTCELLNKGVGYIKFGRVLQREPKNYATFIFVTYLVSVD